MIFFKNNFEVGTYLYLNTMVLKAEIGRVTKIIDYYNAMLKCVKKFDF